MDVAVDCVLEVARSLAMSLEKSVPCDNGRPAVVSHLVLLPREISPSNANIRPELPQSSQWP